MVEGSSSRDWGAALALGVRLGVITPEAAAWARERLAARGDAAATAVEVAEWAGIAPGAVDGLLQVVDVRTRSGGIAALAEALLSGTQPAADGEPTLRLPRGTPSPDAPTVASPPACPPLPNVPRTLGPYELMEPLGHGGMGVVFRAKHERLGHLCAVKVLISGEHASADAIARFQREAASVAKMGKHPNIVTVHDLGQEGSLVWYAMELVEGKSMRAVLAERDVAPEEAARWVEKVARAVHFAHTKGVIHRDLKPDNVVIGADGEPQVMDFGLALDVSTSARLSVTGDVFGSPNYMAPEQARGEVEKSDARTDVYGLGGILYEALTKIPPHPGRQVAEILASVLRGDVLSPRRVRPDLPRDLETICLKCLDSDQARRYASAEALADDLARFTRGEPIHARRVTPVERAWKRVKRSPVMSGLIAALVLAAVTLLMIGWKAVQERQEKERLLTESLDRLNLLGKALVDASLARRAMGDMKGCREYAEQLTGPIDELKQRARTLPEPWYHEGRMLRALQLNDEAEHAQDEAVKLASAADATRGSRGILPLALYERGVLRLLRYQTLREDKRSELVRMRAAGRRPDDAPPEVPSTPEVEAAYPEVTGAKRQAADDLRRVARLAGGEPGGAVSSCTRAAAGMLAVLNGRPDAERPLREALSEDRYAVEVYAALAGLAIARRNYEAAARCYEEGNGADRGYLPHLLGLASALDWAAQAAESRGEDGTALRERSLAALDGAIALDGHCAAAWSRKADILWRNGEALWAAGKEVEAHTAYDAALRAIDQALSIDPRSAAVASNQAMVYRSLGDAKRSRGEDPSGEYAKALQACEQALSVNPSLAEAANNQAMVHQSLGDARRARGEDPSGEYAKALLGYEKALLIDPRFAQAANNRAMVYQMLGEGRRARGEDPSGEYAKALVEYERALRINPESADVAGNQAALYQTLGDAKRARGEDPSGEYAKALLGYEKALSVNAKNTQVANNQALLYHALGDAKCARGEDPRGEYGKALLGFEKVLALNPRNVQAVNNLGTLCQALGDAKRARGEDPSGEYEKALHGFEVVLSIDPGDAGAVNNQALAYRSLGDAKRSRGQDASEEYAKALLGFEKALSLNPRLAEAAFNQALVYQSLGDAKRARGEDPGAEYEKVLLGYEKALFLNPTYAKAAYNQALLYQSLADAKRTRGADPGREYEKALLGYERALSINPKYADAIINQANVYQSLGDVKRGRGEDPGAEYERALGGYERALSIHPRSAEAEHNRANVYASLGDARRARKEDASGEYAKALVGYEKALSINPKYAEAANNQASVYQSLGDAKRERGEDPSAEYDKALAGNARALGLDPNNWKAHSNRGLLLEALGRYPEAVDSFESAFRIVGDRYPPLKVWLARARTKAGGSAQTPAWVAQTTRADEAIQRGDYVSARGLYEKALTAAGSEAEKAASMHSALAGAHYNLACIYTLASVGRDGPKAGAKAIAPDETAHLRERAFQHLARAIDLGWKDAKTLQEDADLVPLHDDARWVELLRRVAR